MPSCPDRLPMHDTTAPRWTRAEVLLALILVTNLAVLAGVVLPAGDAPDADAQASTRPDAVVAHTPARHATPAVDVAPAAVPLGSTDDDDAATFTWVDPNAIASPQDAWPPLPSATSDPGLVQASAEPRTTATTAPAAAVSAPPPAPRPAPTAAELDALRVPLGSLRGALTAYAIEHDGDYPLNLFVQLTNPTGPDGGPGASCGPYLSNGIPRNPISDGWKVRMVAEMPAEAEGPEGWIYCPGTGEIRANIPGAAFDL